MACRSQALGPVVLFLFACASAGAETRARWVDPPPDHELLRSAAISAALAALSERKPAEPARTSPAPEPVLQGEEAPSSRTASQAPPRVEVEPRAEPRKARRSGRFVRERRVRRAARSQNRPFARLFGPPRRDAHIITTNHIR
jgi:hypothetical protein